MSLRYRSGRERERERENDRDREDNRDRRRERRETDRERERKREGERNAGKVFHHSWYMHAARKLSLIGQSCGNVVFKCDIVIQFVCVGHVA